MATQTTTELELELHPLNAPSQRSEDRPLSIGRTVGPSKANDLSSASVEPVSPPKLSQSRAWIVMAQLVSVNFIVNFCGGIVTIGLPVFARDLHLADNLLIWPISVTSLTGGACVLLAGTITDVLGAKKMYLSGAFLNAIFILACGLTRTGIELIMFRALQGIAGALSGPSASSMISTNIERGRTRNVGFATLYLAFPLGYGLGMVVGGVLVNTVGWRAGFFGAGVLQFLIVSLGIWTLPKDKKLGSIEEIYRRLSTEIDWVGALIACTCISTFSYVLAALSAKLSDIKQATNIALLTLSLALIPTFITWMHFQEKRHKPALIRNSIWKSTTFTSVLVIALISNAVIKVLAQFSSLYFQRVQLLSASEGAIRFIPMVIVSAVLNIFSGIFVNKIPVSAALLGSSVLCTIASLLMALTNPAWSYWYSIFWAQILAPVNIDVVFLVASLVVADAFPKDTQAIAGATLSTFGQLGSSMGLCTMSLISATVTRDSPYADKSSPGALLDGYRATFWAGFVLMGIACVIGAVGLRKVGKVGAKND